MNNIMETMFLKRFCLPSNTDLDEFKSNNMVANKCICGHYFHVSCAFQGNQGKYNILSFGMNKYADVEGIMPSIHAEHDAILRLPNLQKNKNRNKKNKKLVKINLLVIRFLKTYTLANSKPCLNCIQNMINLPQTKGYKIEDIYYSENDETIVKTSINKLLNETSHHVSSYYRNNRYLHRNQTYNQNIYY